MTTAREHRDNQKVCVEMWIVDLLDGDHAAAVLLSQLLWWFQPAKGQTRPRVRYEREGALWLLRADDDWWDDCRLTAKQVRRIRKVLLDADLIVYRRFKWNGGPTSAWQPNASRFAQMDESEKSPAPEWANQGAPEGETGRPDGSLPIDTDLKDKPKRQPLVLVADEPKPTRASAFPEQFFITPEMRQWAMTEVPTVDLQAETRKFCDHFRANGKRMKDWTAAWRNWMRKSIEWGPRRDGASTARAKEDRTLQSIQSVLGPRIQSERQQSELGVGQ